jgi:glycosyltransferase involved in cell wall biosynthesis
MNKGIKIASGNIIGMLNADDYFTDVDILNTVANAFIKYNADIIYGDLDYVNAGGNVIRKWRSKEYKQGMFNRGWMPAHPTFYCKRNLFTIFGLYSLEYGTAADYELMLRFMHLNKNIKSFYVKKVMIKMSVGGASNKSYSNRVKGLLYDLKAMRNNGIKVPVLTLLFKPLRKIIQYF